MYTNIMQFSDSFLETKSVTKSNVDYIKFWW